MEKTGQNKVDLISVRHSLAPVAMGLQTLDRLANDVNAEKKHQELRTIAHLSFERLTLILAQIDKEIAKSGETN